MSDPGQMLRDVRHKRRMSLRAVEDKAEALGRTLSAGGLQRIEVGKRHPNARTLELLARIYDIKIVIDKNGTRVE